MRLHIAAYTVGRSLRQEGQESGLLRKSIKYSVDLAVDNKRGHR